MRRSTLPDNTGTLFIGDGYAEVEGSISENSAHSHLTFQLTIGIDGPIELMGDGGTKLIAAAALVAPNVRHRIGPAARHVRSLYVEPQLSWARAFTETLGPMPMVGIGEDWARLAVPPIAIADTRAARLRMLIENAPQGQGPCDLAKTANMSASRFRALCVELLGAPPVRLRQWARLKAAARAIAEGATLADAAAAAGYADQSHFTRQLRRWFGVSPAKGLAALRIRIAQ